MKTSHIIAILVIGIAIAAILTTVSDSSTYASFTKAKDSPDKEFHVVGHLDKAKPQEYDPMKDPNRFTFYLTDNDSSEMQVVYKGTKPQDFERSEQIVVIGKVSGEVFEAGSILMKCPSKYSKSGEMKEYMAAPEEGKEKS